MRWNTLAVVIAATVSLSAAAVAQTTPRPAPNSPQSATTGAGGHATMSGGASEPGGYMPNPQRQPSAKNKKSGGLSGFPKSPLVNGSSAGTYTGTGIETGR